MKLPSCYSAMLAFTGLSSLAFATINVTFPFSSVTPGGTYELSWTQDTNYTLELWLVREYTRDLGGWDSIEALLENKLSSPPGGAYSWTVRKGYESGSGYGLWLSGKDTPYGWTGYANGTDWFEITKGHSCGGEDELR